MTQPLIAQLHAVRNVLNANLEGISHEQSVQQPEPAGNCLNWIVGHLVATYDKLLEVLGANPVLTPEQHEVYDRGVEPLIQTDRATPFGDLRDAFTSAHERVVAAIEQLPAGRLGEASPYSPTNNPDETIGSLIAIFAFHQAYHTGQTGLGRRLVGMPNAIT